MIGHILPTCARQRRQAGFTMIELMVSIAIGLFLIAGLTSLMVASSVNSSELNKTATEIENGRYALQILSEDVQHAGFWGGYGAASTTLVALPATLCGTTLASLGFNAGTVTFPVGIYGFAGASSTPACTPALDHRIAGTDILVVRRASTTAIPVASAAANEFYIQVGNCATVATPFVLDTNPASFTLTNKDCATASTIRKYMVHIYYLSSCNDCTSDTTPTLKVAEFVNGAFQITPLVEGIENLQIEYGIDTDGASADTSGAGAPDCYTSDPSAVPAAEAAACVSAGYDLTTATPLVNWGNVVAARIHVLSRNLVPTAGWVDSRTYDLGLGVTAGPANDAYKRHAYSAVARIYNIAGVRESP